LTAVLTIELKEKIYAERGEYGVPIIDAVDMRYNWACYECQLGRLKEAEDWLHK